MAYTEASFTVRQRVPKNEITQILKDHQVTGDSLDNLGPRIEVDDHFYFLTPRMQRKPRQLILVDEFVKEFDSRWRPTILTAHGSTQAA